MMRSKGRPVELERVILSVRIPTPLERSLRELAKRERRTLSEQTAIVVEHGLRAIEQAVA